MEGLPHMPMFKVPWKPSPVSPDISSIKKKVRARYGEQMHIDEQLFTSFLQLRTNSCRPPIDVSSISKIRRYYAQLMLLKNRINLSEPKFVHWPWQDALVESSFVRDEAEYEEAATLYNLGSAHSIVGEQESRADDDSLKQACTQFQCAAWVFQTLRERYAQFENANDMHGDLCRFYHSLMLGQAQECVTEKSMLDGRPPIVTAKLTKFLTESYDYCWNQLNAQTLASLLPEKFLREWKRLVLVKKLAFSALSNYFLAMDAATKMKFGPGVTWLKQADTDITQAVKVAKEASNASNSPRFGAPLLAVVTFAQNVISASYKSAVKDNDTVYHDRVPSLDELDAIKGANVVKPIPFDHTDPEVVGQDIFKDLLPIETLEASSMYSEMKADFLRKILAEVEEKDVALGSFMSSINLDPKDLCKPDARLPQGLLDVCAQLQSMDPPPEGELSSRMKALVNVGVDVESDTTLITTELQELREKLETLKDDKAAKPLTDRLSRITDYHAKLAEAVSDAKHSNTQLNRALTEHLTAVRILLKPTEEIAAGLPSVKEMISDEELLSGLDEAARVLEKVNEMRSQRDTLVSQLRAAVQADDITQELLTADPADHESIFEARLKRHESAVAILRQNLAAQENITKALVELNAKVAVKKHNLLEQRERRTEEVDSLIRSGESFGELLLKCDEGQNFYKQMSERLQKLRSELTELADEVERLQPKLEAAPTTPALAYSPGSMIPEVPRLGDYLKAKRLAAAAATATSLPVTTSLTPLATTGVVGTTVPVNPPILPYWRPVVPQPYPQVPGFSPVPFDSRGAPPATVQAAQPRPTVTSHPVTPQTPQMDAPMPFVPYGQVNASFRAPGKETYAVPPTQAVSVQSTQLPQHPHQQQQQTLSRPPTPQCFQYPYQPVAFPAQGGYPLPQQSGVMASGVMQPQVAAQPPRPSPLGGDVINSSTNQQPQGSGSTSSSDATASSLINQPSSQTTLSQSDVVSAPHYSVQQQQKQPQQVFCPTPSTVTHQGPTISSYSVPAADHRYSQSTRLQPAIQQQTVLKPVIGSYPMRLQQPPTYAVQGPPQQPLACQLRQPVPDQAQLGRSGPATPQPPYSHTPPPGPATQTPPPSYSHAGVQPVATPSHLQTFTPSITAPVPQGYVNMTAPGARPFVQASMVTPQDPPVGYPAAGSMYQQPTAYHGLPQYSTGSLPGLQTSDPGRATLQQYPQQSNQYYAQPAALRPGTPTAYQQPPRGGQPSVSADPGALQASPSIASGETASVTTVMANSATVANCPEPAQVGETTLSKCAAEIHPILPQVLTQDDIEVQRREKQLRAAYAAQPQQWNLENPDGSTVTTLPIATVRSNSVHSADPQQKSPVSNQVDVASGSVCKQRSVEHQSLSDPLVLNRFITATERLLSWLETLNEPFENAIEDGDDCVVTTAPQRAVNEKPKATVSRLDHAWLRISEVSNFSGGDKRPTLATARCCAAKNRSQDCVPYDMNRVVLRSLKEDYINASHMDFISTLGDWCPRYILTQAPLCNTVGEFWTMIFEQGCEVVALLLPLRSPTLSSSPSISTLPSSVDPTSSLAEGAYGEPTDKKRVPPHLPALKVGSRLSIPGSSLELRLQAVKLTKSESTLDIGAYQHNGDSLPISESLPRSTCIERVLTLQNRDTQQTRSIVHLCYTGKFPVPTDTSSVGAFTAFIQSVHGFYKQQRNLMHPIAVACETGCGLGGIFVTSSIAMLQAEALGQLADVCDIAGRVCQQRRGALGQASHLAAACATVAQAAVQTLARRDIVVGPKQYRRLSEVERTRMPAKTRQQHPAVDTEGQNRDLASRLFSDQPMNLSELMYTMGSWGRGGKCGITSDAAESAVQACPNTGLSEAPMGTAQDQQNQEQPQGATVVKPEPIRASGTGEANLFSDLPQHLVSLSISQQPDQAGLAKRHYQARDFVDQEFREVRDKQHASASQLFQDLDPLHSSPAGNQ